MRRSAGLSCLSLCPTSDSHLLSLYRDFAGGERKIVAPDHVLISLHYLRCGLRCPGENIYKGGVV